MIAGERTRPRRSAASSVSPTAITAATAPSRTAVRLAVYLSLRFSVGITKVVKESGIVLLTRIAGLLLSAIAVQLIADSVRGFITQT